MDDITIKYVGGEFAVTVYVTAQDADIAVEQAARALERERIRRNGRQQWGNYSEPRIPDF